MRKTKGRAPRETEDDFPTEVGPGMSMQPGSSEAPEGFRPGKTGLNDSDVVALVRAMRSGMSWAKAKQTAGYGIVDSALEGWRPEIERRAGRVGPVLLGKPEPVATRVERIAGPAAGQLDIALAAIVAGRADLAMRVLRELGADEHKAPDKWIDQVTAVAPRVAARAAAAPAPVGAPSEEAPRAPAKRGRPRRIA